MMFISRAAHVLRSVGRIVDRRQQVRLRHRLPGGAGRADDQQPCAAHLGGSRRRGGAVPLRGRHRQPRGRAGGVPAGAGAALRDGRGARLQPGRGGGDGWGRVGDRGVRLPAAGRRRGQDPAREPGQHRPAPGGRAPAFNDGAAMLRRGFSYVDGGEFPAWSSWPGRPTRGTGSSRSSAGWPGSTRSAAISATKPARCSRCPGARPTGHTSDEILAGARGMSRAPFLLGLLTVAVAVAVVGGLSGLREWGPEGGPGGSGLKAPDPTARPRQRRSTPPPVRTGSNASRYQPEGDDLRFTPSLVRAHGRDRVHFRDVGDNVRMTHIRDRGWPRCRPTPGPWYRQPQRRTERDGTGNGHPTRPVPVPVPLPRQQRHAGHARGLLRAPILWIPAFSEQAIATKPDPNR